MKTKMSFLLFFFIILLNPSLEAQDSLLYIVIRDAPDGEGRQVYQVSMTTDDSLTLYTAGYDRSYNFIGDYVAKWSVTGDLDQMTEDSTNIFVFSPSTAPTSGSIRATVGIINHHIETITVDVGAHCYYEIQVPCPPPFDILGGGEAICLPEYEDTTIAYVGDFVGVGGASYDCDGNYRRDEDVPNDSTVSIDSTNFSSIGTLATDIAASWSANWSRGGVLLQFKNAGEGRYILNGTDTSGVIIIQEPNTRVTEYIQIRDAPDGNGYKIRTFIMHAGDTRILYAARYDSSDNFIRNQIVEWSTTGTLDPVSVIDTALVFSPINDPCMSGAYGTIIATAGDLSYTTDIITVLRCGVCYIEIHCAPYGASSENDCFPDYEDTITVHVGDSLSLWAAAYDNGNNYMYDMELGSVDFEFTGTLNLENWVFTEIGQGRIIAKDIDTSGIYIVEEPTSINEDEIIKSGFKLEQAYPNPFNPSTTIQFYLPKTEHVILEVYNNIGQIVETLIDRQMTTGEHKVEFNAMHLSSGVYYYRLVTANFTDVKKIILMK